VVTPNTKATNGTAGNGTAENGTADESTSKMPAFAQNFREQLLSTVQQSQQLSIDAAQTWVKVVSVLPAMDLPKISGIHAMPNVESATKYTFDVAADLLNAQREYALQLATALVPAKKS
jgi:hypothetical protein